MSDSPKARAHAELVATPPATASRPTLSAFSDVLPTPAHEPGEDLSVAPMEQRRLSSAVRSIRAGSIVTINTALQGTVTAVGETDPEELWYEPSSISADIITVDPFNGAGTTELHIVKDGSTYAGDFSLFYQLEDGTRTEIKHLAVSNEDNLRDHIDADAYNTFKQYIGGTAIAVERGTANSPTSMSLYRIDGAEDGRIVLCSGAGNETTVTIERPFDNEWYLHPSGATAADSCTLFTDEEGAFGAATIDACSETQTNALQTVTDLPSATYSLCSEGLVATATVNKQEVGATVEDAATCATAFPGLYPIGDDDTAVEPVTRKAPGGPDAPVTEITGIGPATVGDLAAGKQTTTQTKSRAAVIEQFEQSDVDDVRELTDAEIEARFGEIGTRRAPAGSTDGADQFSLSQLDADGFPLFRVSDQYRSRAVAEVRSYIESTSGDATDILRLHAGATNGRLYGADGQKVGLFASLSFGSVDMDAVEAVTAWSDSDGNPVLPQENAEIEYGLTTDATQDIHVVSRKRSNRVLELTDETVPATGTTEYGGLLTFHNVDAHTDIDTAIKTQSLTIAAIPYAVGTYVNALFGVDVTDQEFIANHVRIDDNGTLYIEHPELNLTFVAGRTA